MNAPYTLQRHKLSVEDYHRMGEAGILREDSRVELIEGDLIDKSPIGSAHASVLDSLVTMLVRLTDDRTARVSSQNPLSLPPDSEPEPDAMLLRPRADRYRDALPGAADVLLLIEVADSSLGYDRGAKLPLYARHGIAEVWIVDIQKQLVDVYRVPGPDGYRSMTIVDGSGAVTPLNLPGLSFPIASIFS